MLRKVFFLILLCMAFCFILKEEAYAFSIEPARVELSIPAGKQRGKTITVDNTKSDEPLHLRMYTQDVVFLADGTNDFPPAGSTSRSCANWVRIIPEEIDVPAGKTGTIRINLSVPAEAKGGYYGMLFFESGSGYIQGVGINFRLGGLLDVSVPKTEVLSAKVSDIAFVKPKQIDIGIFNKSNILIRPKGKIRILDPQDKKKKIKQIDFNPNRSAILPDSLRKISSQLDAPLPKGEYILKAEIDYGTKYLLVAELPLRIE